jgi:hypothetical protein
MADEPKERAMLEGKVYKQSEGRVGALCTQFCPTVSYLLSHSYSYTHTHTYTYTYTHIHLSTNMSSELFEYIHSVKPSLGDAKRAKVGILLIHYITLAVSRTHSLNLRTPSRQDCSLADDHLARVGRSGQHRGRADDIGRLVCRQGAPQHRRSARTWLRTEDRHDRPTRPKSHTKGPAPPMRELRHRLRGVYSAKQGESGLRALCYSCMTDQ